MSKSRSCTLGQPPKFSDRISPGVEVYASRVGRLLGLAAVVASTLGVTACDRARSPASAQPSEKTDAAAEATDTGSPQALRPETSDAEAAHGESGSRGHAGSESAVDDADEHAPPPGMMARAHRQVSEVFAQRSPAIGTALPNVPVYDAQGKRHALRDMIRGRHTVLVFGCLT